MNKERSGLRNTPVVWGLLACLGLVAGYLSWMATGGASPRGEAALNEHAEAALRTIDATLAKFPAAPDPTPERRNALMTLDAILHNPDAPARPAVQQFFHRRIEHALAQMRDAGQRPGATIWLIYNHGFVVRTPSATVCFDLVRAKYLPGFALDRGLMRGIAEQCDVLFVSHVHADHAESFVAQVFVDQGKPVVAPQQIGYREPLGSRVTRLEPVADKVQSLPIRQGRANLQVVVYPGHQGSEIDNNVVLVTTPDGISIAHTGDQWDSGADFEWIDRVAKRFRVDILLPNDWTYDIARMVRGFDPAMVIPGHQNELGHGIEKRDPYRLSFQRKTGSGLFGGISSQGYSQPLVVMAWGESFHYLPTRWRRADGG